MHRQNTLFRQDVIHQGEDRFLNLPSILAAPDQNQFAIQVRQDETFGIGAVPLWHRIHEGRVQDGRIRHEIRQGLSLWNDKHVAREQGVPGAFRDDAHLQPIGWIRPGIQVLNIQIAVLQIDRSHRMQAVETVLIDRLIDLAPPDAVLRIRLFQDKFIIRGAPGIFTRLAGQRPTFGNRAQPQTHRRFIQRLRAQIPVLHRRIDDAVFTKPIGAAGDNFLGHQIFLHGRAWQDFAILNCRDLRPGSDNVRAFSRRFCCLRFNYRRTPDEVTASMVSPNPTRVKALLPHPPPDQHAGATFIQVATQNGESGMPHFRHFLTQIAPIEPDV